jgi:N-acetylmuramoyl-L-alanine amidase
MRVLPVFERKESIEKMKKRFLLSVILVVAVLSATPLATAADSDPGSQPAGIPVYIDGEPADFKVPAFILDKATYVSIREFTMAMGAESVSWNEGTATVTAPNLTLSAASGDIYLVANSRYLFVPSSCLLMSNNLMAPIRVLAKAFDATIIWNPAQRAVYIEKGSGAIEPGSSFYNDDDVYWMSRIINAESRGEPLVGKIAVGGVIMNRIASPSFPDTVYDVIFDKQYGIQFTPAYSGAIYNAPSEECVIAAKIVLDGGNTAGDSLYFSSSSQSCWAARTRPFSMTIGNHSFYA